MEADELIVEHLAWLTGFCFEQQTHQCFEQRDIAVDLHLKEEVGDLRAPTENLGRALWIDETHQARLGERVNRNDPRAVLLCLLQCGQHAWMVRPWVLPHHDDRVGFVHVVERDGALPNAHRLTEADAARLVAHVGAVGKIVRSKRAHEQLVEKRRLVAGAPGGVEDRFVRRVEPL